VGKWAVVVLSGLAFLAGGGTALALTSGPPHGRAALSRVADTRTVGTEEGTAGASAAPASSDNLSAGVACPAPAGGPSTSSGLGTDIHVFTRTTDDSVTIRVYRSAGNDIAMCDPPTGSPNPVPPAVRCGGPEHSIELSDATAVGQGFLGLPVAAFSPNPSSASTIPSTRTMEPEELESGAFGVAEDDPVWWVAIQVGSEVATAQVKFADGSTDEMTPENSIAVLAHHINASVAGTDPYEVRGTLQLLDSSRDVLATVSLPEPAPQPIPRPTPVPQGSTGAGSGAISGSPGSQTVGSAFISSPPEAMITACTMVPATTASSSHAPRR